MYQDLIWEPRLRAITSKDSSISAHFYVSGEKKLSKTAPKAAKAGAVDMAAIQKLGVDVKNSVYYVCGPLGMIQDLTAKLEAAGVPKECIITERWL
jgi:NAD(P)H-flavin reductase